MNSYLKLLKKMKIEYKLFNTDGKTFFDFRSNPDSRMEAFVITMCDDGTVVMTGDYGCLCWKREWSGRKDYGFPDEMTNITYFAEKICRHGVEQKIMEFNMKKAIEEVKEQIKDMDEPEAEGKSKKDLLEELEWLEDYDEIKLHETLSEYYPYECDWGSLGMKYTDHFVFIFETLKSVSKQILEAVSKEVKE